MTREQLEHIIRAASDVSGERDIVIVGSQAILGTYPQAPAALLRSREAAVYPRDAPEKAMDIDANIGEMSVFDDTFSYYAHGVGPTTVVGPKGWESRLVPVTSETTGGATGWCLEVHDLLLAKVAAGRDRDWQFVEDALRHGLAEPSVLRARLRLQPIDPQRLADKRHQLEAAIARAPAKRQADG